MKLSIIIPVYNTAPYLPQCLESALRQGFDESEYEIITILEPCDDNSGDILANYAKTHANIRIIANKIRSGQSYNRNLGITVASGKYIYFLDSDDYLIDNALIELYNMAETYKTDIIYFNCKVFRDSGNSITVAPETTYIARTDVCSGPELLVDFMEHHNSITLAPWIQLSTRKFFLDNHILFHEGIVHEDIPFFLECILQAKKVKYTPRFYYNYRKREFSTTTKPDQNNCKSFVYVWQDMLKCWKQAEITKNLNNAVDAYIDYALKILFSYQQKINNSFDIEFDKPWDQYLYKIISIYSKYLHSSDFSFNRNDIDKMKHANSVWVYGAGKIATFVIPYLVAYGIKIKGCIVSQDTNQQIYGWQTIKYDRNTIVKSDIIVVAVKGWFGKEIIDNLHSDGFLNVIWACDNI